MFWSWDIIILKLPYASLRNALLQYHMIEIYHVIYFEYDSYSNRETDFQDTWKSELGIQKNLNSAYRKLENVVGKVRNKLGKILRNENFPTSFSFYLWTFHHEYSQLIDFTNYSFHLPVSPKFSSTQLCVGNVKLGHRNSWTHEFWISPSLLHNLCRSDTCYVIISLFVTCDIVTGDNMLHPKILF